ncbi:MAG: hypothetical protein RR036_01960 [Oscillospiraceae bacterium]
MKKISLLIAFIVIITLSGCNYQQNAVDNLLSPPKLSKQQDMIYKALEESVGKNITLKYPRTGDFKSAFLIADLDQESTQEAIVFYEQTPNNSFTNPLKINVLDQKNDRWSSMCEIGVNATEVEKVSFIKADNKTYIIIGFNVLGQSEKELKVYSYQNSMLEEVYNAKCRNFEVIDIDSDGKREIITLTNKQLDNSTTVVSQASLYDIFSSGVKLLSSVNMDPNVIEYVNIAHGLIDTTTPALFLDGMCTNNNMVTEILSYQDNNLVNLIYKDNQDYEDSLIAKTARNAPTHCMDINDDLIYEIPTLTQIDGYKDVERTQQLYYTNWYNYKNNDLVLHETDYVDYSLGFLIKIKREWIGKITLQFAPSTNELTVCEYDANQQATNKIFSVRVTKKDDPNIETIKKEYQTLDNYGQLMYMFKLDSIHNSLGINSKDVLDSFSLL